MVEILKSLKDSELEDVIHGEMKASDDSKNDSYFISSKNKVQLKNKMRQVMRLKYFMNVIMTMMWYKYPLNSRKCHAANVVTVKPEGKDLGRPRTRRVTSSETEP